MKRWLVFGLTGQVGRAFRDAVVPGEAELLAVSRHAQADRPDLHWLQGGLGPALAPAGDFEAFVSLGPLDLFARWFETSAVAPARVVALGSTSVHSKAASPDPAERELAARLADAEKRLAAACHRKGSALVLLRPTLIYGGGERSLSRIVGLARRWHWLPLPRNATGRRQPVHAGDLAQTVLECLRSPSPRVGAYDLPGGETLAYDRMLERVLEVAAPGARLVRVPAPLFRAGVRLLSRLGLEGAGEGLLARFEHDLVFDAGPAVRDLGYAPRPFRPTAEMFRS